MDYGKNENCPKDPLWAQGHLFTPFIDQATISKTDVPSVETLPKLQTSETLSHTLAGQLKLAGKQSLLGAVRGPQALPLLRLKFMHNKYDWIMRYDELPRDMPWTFYHLGEVLERKFLLAQTKNNGGSRQMKPRSFNRVDSALVMIFQEQLPFYYQQQEQRMKKDQGKYTNVPIYEQAWFQNIIISPFDKFDYIRNNNKKDLSLILIRIPRMERYQMFNQRFNGNTWILKLQSMYQEYESSTDVQDKINTLVIGPNNQNRELNNVPPIPEKEEEEDEDDEDVLMDKFLKDTIQPSILTVSPDEQHPICHYRRSYITQGFSFQQYLKRLNPQLSIVKNNTSFMGTIATRLELPNKTILKCKRIIPHLPNGILKKDMIELTIPHYLACLTTLDFSQILVYEDATTNQQYILQRDVGMS